MHEVGRSDTSILRELAREARGAAYAPYSGFSVGACLEADDGRRFAGCNVENASLPVTMCAERVALGSAVAAGAVRFRRIYLVADSDDPIAPCGMCRQALAEFGLELSVTSEGRNGGTRTWKLGELLPEPFVLAAGARHGRMVR